MKRYRVNPTLSYGLATAEKGDAVSQGHPDKTSIGFPVTHG
jgi:hypothetical protein